MGEKSRNRRQFLQAIGSVSAIGALSSSASAARRRTKYRGDSQSCESCGEVVLDDEDLRAVKMESAGSDSLFKVDKVERVVRYEEVDGKVDPKSVSAQSRDDIALVENFDGIFRKTGSCSSWGIRNHYLAGAHVETIENPNEMAVSMLSGAICALIPVATPIPGDEVIAGALCAGAAYIVQQVVFDTTFTVALSDTDDYRLWPSERLDVGGSPYYTTDPSDLHWWSEADSEDPVPGHVQMLLNSTNNR